MSVAAALSACYAGRDLWEQGDPAARQVAVFVLDVGIVGNRDVLSRFVAARGSGVPVGQAVVTGDVVGAEVGATVVGAGAVVGAGVVGTTVVVVGSTVEVTATDVEVATDEATLEPDEPSLSLQLAMASTIATVQAVANVRPPTIDVPSKRQPAR